MLRGSGWTVAIVEKWNPHVKIRQDLFGFADLLAIYGEGNGTGGAGSIAAVQVTSTKVAERVRKILNEPRSLTWLLAGGRIFVHGWRKVKVKRGGKAMKYECREIEMGIDNYIEAWVTKRYR